MKNKPVRIMALLMSMMLFLAAVPGCGSTDEAADTEEAAASEELNTDNQTADSQQIGTDPNTGQPIESVDISGLGGNGADVDVSKLSSTMVYSVVYDMLTYPDKYIGKKIRITGDMSVYHDEDTGNTYYACLIQDATACCAQGLEFQTTDEFDPSDYPADGESVTVLGTYDLYEEDGYQYCVLKDAVLE